LLRQGAAIAISAARKVLPGRTHVARDDACATTVARLSPRADRARSLQT
jgi:hypothetical protein